MKYVTIEELVNDQYYPIGDGDHGSIKPSYYQDEGVPYIRVADISQEGEILKEQMVYISQLVHDQNKKSWLKPGDIIISKTGATIGKVAIIPDDMLTSNTTASVGKITLDPEKAYNRYIYRYLQSPEFQSAMWRVSKKSAQPGFNVDNLKRFLVPIPDSFNSVEIQKSITNIVDKASILIKKRKETIKLADEFLHSTFLEMFGDPKKIKVGISGNELFKFSSGKFNPVKNLDDSFIYPTYGGNGITGYSSEYLIDFDTIVIGRVGAYCGSIHRTRGKSWITDNAIFIKEFKKEFNLEYLQYLFEYQRLNRFANYSGQPKITQTPLEELIYPDTNIEMQNKFGSVANKVYDLKEKYQTSLTEMENQFNSLMQRAFRGEL